MTPAQFNAVGHRRAHRRLPDDVPAVVADRAARADPPQRVIPPVVAGTGVNAQVGGETAASIDAANFLGHRLFIVIGAVLVLSFLLLMVSSARWCSRSRR